MVNLTGIFFSGPRSRVKIDCYVKQYGVCEGLGAFLSPDSCSSELKYSSWKGLVKERRKPQ